MIFVDTSAIIAALSADDRYHDQAANVFRELRARGEIMAISNYAVVEVISLVHRRLGASAVSELIDKVLPIMMVLWVEPGIHRAALGRFAKRPASNAPSFVDCTSFEIMSHHGIGTAFTYDSSHFEDHGFGVIG